mgnify:CR=1 FL=1
MGVLEWFGLWKMVTMWWWCWKGGVCGNYEFVENVGMIHDKKTGVDHVVMVWDEETGLSVVLSKLGWIMFELLWNEERGVYAVRKA